MIYYDKLGIYSLHDLEVFLDREDVVVMIGKNYDHYREYWLADYRRKIMREPKQKIKGSFNWLAFFLTPAWFGYRRMYAWILGLSVAMGCLAFIEEYFELEASTGSMTGIGIAFALLSKGLYLQHLVKCTEKIDGMPNRERKERFMTLRSGVSIALSILSVQFLLVVVFLGLILAEYLKTGAVTF